MVTNVHRDEIEHLSLSYNDRSARIHQERYTETLRLAFSLPSAQARLAFCKFMVKPSTLLVLDEPTNHLDIPSQEMLEEAINEYKGTVITVSHDRHFIKQIVNRVLEVKDGTLQDYAGDYNLDDWYITALPDDAWFAERLLPKFCRFDSIAILEPN